MFAAVDGGECIGAILVQTQTACLLFYYLYIFFIEQH
jgi:hypothetical protein